MDETGQAQDVQVMDDSRGAQAQAAGQLRRRLRLLLEIAQDAQARGIGERFEATNKVVGNRRAGHQRDAERARAVDEKQLVRGRIIVHDEGCVPERRDQDHAPERWQITDQQAVR